MSEQGTQNKQVPVEHRSAAECARLVRPVALSSSGPALALNRPRAIDERGACTEAFGIDVCAMCALIAEADRYGTTSEMEEQYRDLRTSLAQGYRAVAKHLADASLPRSGFHGGGFEIILVSFSLESLVRNTGARAADRLAAVWHAVRDASSGA